MEGQVSIEENAAGKVMANKIRDFSEVPSELWIAFKDKETYMEKAQELTEIILANHGNDKVIVALDVYKRQV